MVTHNCLTPVPGNRMPLLASVGTGTHVVHRLHITGKTATQEKNESKTKSQSGLQSELISKKAGESFPLRFPLELI